MPKGRNFTLSFDFGAVVMRSLFLASLLISCSSAFVRPSTTRSIGVLLPQSQNHRGLCLPMVPLPEKRSESATGSTSSSNTVTTLTADTTWKLRIGLRNIATTNGQRLDNVLFVVTGQFIEETGYEPPQGFFVQQQNTTSISTMDSDDSGATYESGGQFRLVKSRWILSEDPNDRKDGLWVWGLFKEPLYPYMLLQLESDSVVLPNGDSIPPMRLYAQINHKRTNVNSVLLEPRSELKIRQMETIQADPFGAAQVDIYEEVDIGSLSIQPL